MFWPLIQPILFWEWEIDTAASSNDGQKFLEYYVHHNGEWQKPYLIAVMVELVLGTIF
jgi:hypothetical protein